jgi:hypothetical protein
MITKEQAKAIAGKVNELVQSSYRNETAFDMDDVVKLGLTPRQAKVIMEDLVKSRIVYTLFGRFSATPQVLAKIKEEYVK